MAYRIKAFLKFLLFFSIGGLILFLLYRSQSNAYAEQCIIDGIATEDCDFLGKIITDFKSVKIQWLLLIIGMYMASNASRAARWMMMFKPLGHKIKFFNAIATLMFGYFANLGLPRLGEVLRPVALSRYEKIGVEKVIGTIVAERALDVFMLLLFIGLAFTLEYDTIWNYISANQALSAKLMPILSSPLFYIFVVVAGLVGVFILRSKSFKNSKFGKKLFGLLEGLFEGVKSIFKLENPFLFILHTLFIWTMYFLMTRLCFFAFEPTSGLSSLAGLMIFVFGTLGIVIPSPGGMGTYHAALMAGLALYGIEQVDAFSFANIIFFTIQLFCNVFFGLLAYLLLPLMNKNYEGSLSTEN